LVDLANHSGIYGGGKFGSFSLIVGMVLLFTIFLLSFKFGTKDITRSDKIVLALALIAIVIWWQLDNPILALLMVSAIDGSGYIPTLRKSFKDPWSETISFWAIMSVVDILSLLAIAEYNVLTVTYLAMSLVLNMAVVLVCVSRRQVIKKAE
jgi:hypothetical protein